MNGQHMCTVFIQFKLVQTRYCKGITSSLLLALLLFSFHQLLQFIFIHLFKILFWSGNLEKQYPACIPVSVMHATRYLFYTLDIFPNTGNHISG